jgi:hypothetical protein
MNVWRVTKADRDANGNIWVIPPERRLSDLLPPTPVAPAAEATRRVRVGRFELAGLIIALVLIGVVGRMLPGHQDVRSPVVAPPRAVATRAQPSPTNPPTATLAPTTVPTPEPPSPIVIVQPPPPPIECYTVRMDVSDERGVPIGIAEGYSCESQDAARANAAAQADLVKAAHRRR